MVAPLLTQAIADASTNSDLSLRLRALLSRWQSFGSRMARTEMNFRGHGWALLVVAGGVLACARQGRIGHYQWMDAHFDSKHLPVQAGEAIAQREVREPIRARLLGGYSSIDSIQRIKFLWTIGTTSMERSF